MTLLVPWVAFPIVVGLVSLGLGLLVDRISGGVPRSLLLPTGLAAMVTVSSLVITIPGAARLTVPVVVALAAAGLVVSSPRGRLDVMATAAAAIVYVCYGAPVLASGAATFAGYIKLDDTATFLALTDRALEHGRSLAGLGPSSYEAALSGYLTHGYPLGAVLPLGIGHELLRTDVAWLYQPWLSIAAAMGAFGLYRLVTPLVATARLRAVVVVFAAQAALLYGFAQWGGVKEVVAAALIATGAALAGDAADARDARALVPLAVVTAALLNTLSVGAAVWLLPLLVPLVVPLARSVRAVAAVAVVAAALALPSLVSAAEILRGSNREIFESSSELGNLIRPLRPVQMLGVWPTGDFRLDPGARTLTAVLIGLVVLAAGVAVWLAVGRRALGLLVGLVSVLTAAAVYVASGSPWVGAKALAIGSPIVLATALAGCAATLEGAFRLRRVGRLVVAVVASATGLLIVAGVAWSNVLAYHDVDLAPRSQLAELEEIGQRFAGQGPALMTEYQPYGVRHFLRRLDAEGVSELRRRAIPLRDGRLAAKAEYVDLDQLQLPGLLVYRTLVLRRSPTQSRPPTPYRLVYEGRWYDVWQLQDAPPVVLDHSPLGNAVQPAALPSCTRLEALGARGQVAAPPRPLNLLWSLESGSKTLDIAIPRQGRYRIWVGGSIRGRLSVAVDGRPAGSVSRQLQNAGQWLRLDVVELGAGTHRLSLGVSSPSLAPGTGGGAFPLGPLLLQPVARVRIAQPSDALSLCGRPLDWIETLGG
jgi:hypothetical protein